MIATILILVLILIALPVLLMGGWQFYIHKINRNKPAGTDKTMVDWGLCIPVINGFQFKLNDQWPEFYTQFKHRLAELFAAKDSPLKIYFDKNQYCFTYHQNLSLKDIFFEHPNKKACTKLWLPDNVSAILNTCPNEGWIYLIWDHASFDGTRFYNEVLAPLFSLSSYQAPKFFSQYTPCLTEYRIAKLLWQQKSYTKHQPIHTFSDYKDQYCSFIRIDSILLKKLKNKYQTTLSEVILALYCYQIFRLLKVEKQTLKIGLLIACEHERFRNNYSIATLSIKRATKFEHIIKQVKAQQPQPGAIQGMYQLLTFSKTQTFIKENVLDCLISPFFFKSKVAFSKQIKDFEFMNIPTSLPIYSLYISYKNSLNISTTVNSPDIDQQKLQQLSDEIISFSSLS
jgi:hypothetical protein